MEAIELSKINELTRDMINNYMEKKKLTMHKFAKECGIHQSQLWVYLRSGDKTKGLHSGTLERIGEYINDNP